jgi:hypothetical protein
MHIYDVNKAAFINQYKVNYLMLMLHVFQVLWYIYCIIIIICNIIALN